MSRMDPRQIEENVRKILIDLLALKKEAVKPDARFVEDLGADSLDLVQLVMALEETFDLEIPEEDAQKVRTVSEVTQYIQQKLDQAQVNEAAQ